MLDTLNPEQRAAVTHPEGPLLVIAGAGSGKTRVLTTRIAWLVQEQRIPADRILAFTFTNKAAREMQNRVHGMVPGSEGRSWIGTFHATGVRILRREAERIGYDRYFTIYDADDQRTLIKQILVDLKADPKQFNPRAVASEISNFKNRFLTPEQARVQALTARDEKVADAYERYVKRLKQLGAMDFDDLIGKTVELFETHRDVQERYSQKFQHVLVDEFQDTNPLQLVMIRALSAVHGNLCAVGDDDQSIYSWRGATVENMLGFEEYFPGSELVRLEQNYRSTSLILRAANEVIAHNRRRKGKNLWSDRDGGRPIELWYADDDEDEGRRIRDRIRTLLAESDASRKDFVILYRTNAQSRPIEDALRREGMPYQIIGGTRFYERREVRDLLAYLKLVQNPNDAIALSRVINVPKRGIGKTSVERFMGVLEAHGPNTMDVFARLDALREACGNAASKRLFAFGKLIGDLRRLAETADAASILRQVIESTKYEQYLRDDDPATAEDRLLNVSELVNAAHEFVATSDEKGLGPFLESIALLSDLDRSQDTTDLVTLMTVHTAKGLEFPYVFVAGVEENLMPHATSMEEDDGVEEERRLFYVALTRAEEQVFLSSAASRRRFGMLESAMPSRFLREIPEDCMHEMGEAPVQVSPFDATSSYGGRARQGRWTPGTPARSTPKSSANRARGPVSTDVMADARAFLNSKAKKTAQTSHVDHDDVSQVETHFRVGLRIQHESLGEGVIEDLEGSGELLRLTIRFGDHGRKRVLARYARLTVVDEDASF
mgnify:CR=1 FL=1